MGVSVFVLSKFVKFSSSCLSLSKVNMVVVKAASFREAQISIFIDAPAVPEVTVWYRIPMAFLWIPAPESDREETQEDVGNRITADTFDRLINEEMEKNMD